MTGQYHIILIPEAQKEYRKLDGSIKKLVNIAFRKLEERADVLGEPMYDKYFTKLFGCRKIKFRKHGIRIVYRIIQDNVEIVQIIAIAKREEGEVYKLAYERVSKLRKER